MESVTEERLLELESRPHQANQEEVAALVREALAARRNEDRRVLAAGLGLRPAFVQATSHPGPEKDSLRESLSQALEAVRTAEGHVLAAVQWQGPSMQKGPSVWRALHGLRDAKGQLDAALRLAEAGGPS